jgi:predicted RecB family nuclease
VSGAALSQPPPYSRRPRRQVSQKDLTRIWGLGRRFAVGLRKIGIVDYEALMKCDPAEVVTALRQQNLNVSLDKLELWRRHAESYCTGQAIFFGPPPPVKDSFIALDLEYEPFNSHIWLIGLMIVTASTRKYVGLWTDEERQEPNCLRHLVEILNTYPNLPVLTWSGVSADIPQLKSAAGRVGRPDVLVALHRRHVDLFQYARTSMRAPVPELSLGQLANYFGVPKSSSLKNGLEAQMQYEYYHDLQDVRRKAAVKADLIAYNRDDLEALVGILRAMVSGQATITAPKDSQEQAA